MSVVRKDKIITPGPVATVPNVLTLRIKHQISRSQLLGPFRKAFSGLAGKAREVVIAN